MRARPASASRPVETAIHWYDGALHAWVAPPERGDRWTGLHAVAALPLEIPYGPPRPASRPFGGGRTSPSGSAGGRLPGHRGRPGARNGPRAAGGRGRIAPDPAAPAAAPSPLEAGLTNACFNEVDRHVAAGRGDEAALVDLTGAGSRSPRVLTRKQFLLTVVKAAHALAQLGVAEGDRVLLRLPPSAPAVIYLAAIKRLGAVALWAPPGRDEPAAPPCLATRGARAGVRVMVTGGRDSREGGRDPGAVEGWAEVPGVEAVICVGDAGDGLLSWAGRAVVANARAAGFPVAGETDLLILPDADLVRALWTTSRPRPVPAGQRAWLDAAGGGTHASAAGVAGTLAVRIGASPGPVALCVPSGGWAGGSPGEEAWPGVPWPDAVAAAMTLGVTVVLAGQAPPTRGGDDGPARRDGLRVLEAAALLLRISAAGVEGDPEAAGPRRPVLRLYGFAHRSPSPPVPPCAAGGTRTRWVTPDGEILWSQLPA